jgi:polyferredoxin
MQGVKGWEEVPNDSRRPSRRRYLHAMPYAGLRLWKILDVGLQVILVGYSAWAFTGKDLEFLQGYLLVGGWQCISMLLHAFRRGLVQRYTFRWWYHRAVLLLLLLTPLFLLVGPGTMFLVVMLFAAPPMALAYLTLCVVELLRQRPGVVQQQAAGGG